MCGRISLFAELGDLASQFTFALTPAVDGYQPSWNVAPTARILVVIADAGERAAGLMRWGFTSGGQARGGSSSRSLFNARAETVAERPAFRAAYAQRRCLIPVNGFYEWQSGGGGKTPMWIHRSDERPFALAGIYNAEPDQAASVITSAPNSLMAPIHYRMPALLDADDYDAWLDPCTDVLTVHALLQPREWPGMTTRQVSGGVNRAGSDGPHLISAATVATPRLL